MAGPTEETLWSAVFVLRVLGPLPSLRGVKILVANNVRVSVLVIQNPVRVFIQHANGVSNTPLRSLTSLQRVGSS